MINNKNTPKNDVKKASIIKRYSGKSIEEVRKVILYYVQQYNEEAKDYNKKLLETKSNELPKPIFPKKKHSVTYNIAKKIYEYFDGI